MVPGVANAVLTGEPSVASPSRTCDAPRPPPAERATGIPTAVLPTVAGRSRVRVEALRKKLGDAAWWVLRRLWTVRDRNGATHVTNNGLANMRGWVVEALRVVRKACARLKLAGLIEVVGWHDHRVPYGRGMITRQVFVRRVRGAPATGTLGAELFVDVPAVTAAWLSTACSWGGARARKKPEIAADESRIKGGRPAVKRGRPPELQEGPPISYISSGVSDSALLTSSAETAVGATAASVPPSAGDRSWLAEEGPTGRAATTTTLGEGLGVPTRGAPPVLPTTPLRGAPPAPWGLVPLVTLPGPPRLEAGMSDTEAAVRIATAYNEAVRARFGAVQKFIAWGNGPIQKSKHWSMLCKVRKILEEHEIAPIAWAAWSCDIWREYNTSTAPPPVAWVFGPKRVAERRGWFESSAGAYAGGRIIMTPAKRKLVESWTRMRLTIDRAQAWADPSAIADEFFPGDSFARLVALARDEAATEQASLRSRADRGVFLW